MQIEDKGILDPWMKKLLTVLLYPFIGIQYAYLLLRIWEINKLQHLNFQIVMLALLYPAPLALALACNHQTAVMLKQNAVTTKTSRVWGDWMTLMLMVVYLMLLQFAALSQ
jgi:hypothetical protein